MPASTATMDCVSAALRNIYAQKNSSVEEDMEWKENKILDMKTFDDVSYDPPQLIKKPPAQFGMKNPESRVTMNGTSHGSPVKKSEKKEDCLEEPKHVLYDKSRVQLGWVTSPSRRAGMVNLGNTCYLNSSLQALFHIPSFVNWLSEESRSHLKKCEQNALNASFCSLCAMIKTLHLANEHSCIRPQLIVHKLKCIGRMFINGRQEDAHEFIKLLLDHMEKSYLSFRNASNYDHLSKQTTPLNQIFGGYLRQQVSCPGCKYISTTFSHFQDLVLDIRQSNTIEQALEQYFRPETLDSSNCYKCEQCKKKVTASKRCKIEQRPNVLLIQLKRFTFSGGKIGKHIKIEQFLDLSRFMKDSSEWGLYRLVSMVIHLGGSQHGGHYIACGEGAGGVVYELDDNYVHTIGLQTALQKNPYILFYELVNKKSSAKPLKAANSLKNLSSNSPFPSKNPTTNGLKKISLTNGDHSEDLGLKITANGLHSNRAPISFGMGKSKMDRKIDKIILPKSSNKSISSDKSSSPSKSSTTISKSSLVPYNTNESSSSEEEEKSASLLFKPRQIKLDSDKQLKVSDNSPIVTNGQISSKNGPISFKNGATRSPISTKPIVIGAKNSNVKQSLPKSPASFTKDNMIHYITSLSSSDKNKNPETNKQSDSEDDVPLSNLNTNKVPLNNDKNSGSSRPNSVVDSERIKSQNNSEKTQVQNNSEKGKTQSNSVMGKWSVPLWSKQNANNKLTPQKTTISGSNYCFGSKLSTWDGEESSLDNLTRKERENYSKPTDLEEYDQDLNAPSKKRKTFEDHQRANAKKQRFSHFVHQRSQNLPSDQPSNNKMRSTLSNHNKNFTNHFSNKSNWNRYGNGNNKKDSYHNRNHFSHRNWNQMGRRKAF